MSFSNPPFNSAEEELKTRFRPLFRAMHEALRVWPGGSAEIFRMMGRNVHSSYNQLSPSDLDHAPSLLLFLDVLEYTKSRRIAAELASLANCVAVPGAANRQAMDRAAAAERLAVHIRQVLYRVDQFAAPVLCAESRAAARRDLQSLIEAAHAMQAKLYV